MTNFTVHVITSCTNLIFTANNPHGLPVKDEELLQEGESSEDSMHLLSNEEKACYILSWDVCAATKRGTKDITYASYFQAYTSIV